MVTSCLFTWVVATGECMCGVVCVFVCARSVCVVWYVCLCVQAHIVE